MRLHHVKNLSLSVLLTCFVSCNKIKEKIGTEQEILETSTDKLKLDFDHPRFKDRAEELFYIKSYLDENVPKLFLKKNPKTVEEMRKYYAASGRYFTPEYTAYTLTNGDNLSGQIAFRANQENLSFYDVKRRLNEFIPRDRRFEKVKVSTALFKVTNETLVNETPPSEPVDVSKDTL